MSMCTENVLYSNCYHPMHRFLAALLSKATRIQEKAYLDARRELLREKMSHIEVISSRIRMDTLQGSRSDIVSKQDDVFLVLLEDVREREQRYENLLTEVPLDSAERERWYRGKATDFRILGRFVDELIFRANDLTFQYYEVEPV